MYATVEINVWHVNMVAAVVMIKITAHLDQMDHQATLAWMANQVKMDGKAKVEHRVVVKDTNVHQRPADVKPVHLVRKEIQEIQDPLDNLDPRADLETEAVMDVPVAAPLVRLVKLALQDRMDIQVEEVIMVKTPKLEARALLVDVVKTEVQAMLGIMETKVPPVIQEAKVQPADQDLLADLAEMAKMEQEDPLVNRAAQDRMPNIVHAHIAHRPESHQPIFIPVIRDVLLRYAILVFSAKLSISD